MQVVALRPPGSDFEMFMWLVLGFALGHLLTR